jgi:exodeoxyribonuclease VII small subunit
MVKKTPAPTTLDFEAALLELQAIVEKMESGEQTLEEALAAFQRGVELTRGCQKGLKDAEQRVEKLVRENGDLKVRPLSDETDTAD